MRKDAIITSLQNAKVKFAVKLRERRAREHEKLMLVEGWDELSLAQASGLKLQTLFFCADLLSHTQSRAVIEQARLAGAEVIETNQAVFEKMAYRENPDGLLGIAPAWRLGLDDLHLSANPLLVVAEAVEKPGNLGAILRSADAAGVEAVIVCDPTTDVNNPNVIRASRGARFTVPIAKARGAETIAWLAGRGITLLAASPRGTRDYSQVNLTGPLAIVVGTEAEGLSPLWLEQATLRVRIPMRGQVNSLNVATATAVLLYEAVRQRQAKG
jgi:TrmH family RNA methyltransferase